MGRQPWIVQGLLKTADANSPSVGDLDDRGSASACSCALYLVLGVVDFVLMRRYARLDPPRARARRRASRSRRRLTATEMDLENLWFCLVAVLWAGYFLLEGFDFGVGMLLPFLPRDERERERDVRDDRAGLGRQRGLARRRRRSDVRGVPGLVRDDVLGLLHRAAAGARLPDRPRRLVRVAREEREPALAARLDWANAVGSFGAPLIWGVALSNLLHGVPIDWNGDYAGGFSDLFSVYTVLGGLAFVLALRLPRRDVPHAADDRRLLRARGARRAGSRSPAAVRGRAASWSGRWPSRVDRNDKDVFPPVAARRDRDRGARRSRSLFVCRGGAAGRSR